MAAAATMFNARPEDHRYFIAAEELSALSDFDGSKSASPGYETNTNRDPEAIGEKELLICSNSSKEIENRLKATHAAAIDNMKIEVQPEQGFNDEDYDKSSESMKLK